MASDLYRSISGIELEYLRRTNGERARTAFAIAMFAIAGLALLLLHFGLLVFMNGAHAWGTVLLGLCAALVILAVWMVRKPDKSSTLNFRPVVISGLLGSAISTGAGKETRFYIGNDAVVFPRYWLHTLQQQGELRARAALPAAAAGSNDYLPCLVLEIENGPCVEFERASVETQVPLQRPWAALALVLTGFAWIALLGATLGYESSRANLPRAYPAIRAALASVARVHDAEALAAAPPLNRRVLIEAAWRVSASDLEDASSDAGLLVLTQAARDHIYAERQPLLAAHKQAWARYDKELEAYRAKYPRDPLEGLPGHVHPAGERPPLPAAPQLPPVKFDARDVVATVEGSDGGLPYVKPPEDPVLTALSAAVPVRGELYSRTTPLLLYRPETAQNWRDGGIALVAGLVSLITFAAFTALLVRDYMQRQEVIAQLRDAYARHGRPLV